METVNHRERGGGYTDRNVLWRSCAHVQGRKRSLGRAEMESRERAAGERVAENLLAVRWATHAAIMVDHSRTVDQSLLRAVHSRLPRMIRQATADKLRKKKQRTATA